MSQGKDNFWHVRTNWQQIYIRWDKIWLHIFVLGQNLAANFVLGQFWNWTIFAVTGHQYSILIGHNVH